MPWHVFHTSPQFIRGRAGRRIDGVGWEPPSPYAQPPSPYAQTPPTKRRAAIPMCSTGHPPNALAAVPGGVLLLQRSAAVPGALCGQTRCHCEEAFFADEAISFVAVEISCPRIYSAAVPRGIFSANLVPRAAQGPMCLIYVHTNALFPLTSIAPTITIIS
ncbi:MAG TPA: hypothetical protein VIK64_06190, partial [Anaerolineales bacterium]